MLTVATIGRFLVGRRAAIEAIARNRKALPLGVLFCLSTALARHYDVKYLVREPWFLLTPIAASLATSAILFAAMYVVISIKARRVGRGVVPAYLGFLGLYWMTAPLAWLYGIPYERFLDPVAAVQANLWTLGLVSVWRILLMSRVFSVLLPCWYVTALSKFGTFAVAMFYVALSYARVPLFGIMAGYRIPPSARVAAETYMLAEVLLFPGLVGGAVLVLCSLLFRARMWSVDSFQPAPESRSGRGPVWLALAVILLFAAAMPFTQREQWLRYQVETEYKAGRMDAALTILASHKQAEFPPQWTPPPWPEYEDGAQDTKFVTLVEVLVRRKDTPAWVTATYREKADMYVHNNHGMRESAKAPIADFAAAGSQPR